MILENHFEIEISKLFFKIELVGFSVLQKNNRLND